MSKLKRTTDIKQLRQYFDSISTTVASDTRFGAQAIMFIAEHVDAIAHEKPRRKPSEWQKFFAHGMKAGKTPKEIGAEWRARKS